MNSQLKKKTVKFLSLTNGPMKLGKPHCIYKSENMHTNLRNLKNPRQP